jgi:hypothetical protein
MRAVGDFNAVGFFKMTESTEFAAYDTKCFSPLCVCLSITVVRSLTRTPVHPQQPFSQIDSLNKSTANSSQRASKSVVKMGPFFLKNALSGEPETESRFSARIFKKKRGV